ncbi:MAG: hypothetical protein HY828_14845 [Actinobacteria bacterium]|nr:hypothetical protein [Actinomycetota bacterium]
MPDREIEQMAGDALEPTTQFVATLRSKVAGEWRGDIDVVERAPNRRREWKVGAGFVAAAALLLAVVWMTSRDEDSDTVAPSPTSEPGTTVVSDTSPTAGVPASAFGPLWVITSLDGVPLDGPVLPTFTFMEDDTIFGWDGCNEYVVRAEGVEQTAAGCPDGVAPVMASPPFTFDSPSGLHTDRFTARTFEHVDGEAPPTLPFEGTYRFGEVGGFVLTPEGFVSLESRGCEIAVDVRWSVANGNYLTFDFDTIPECYDLDPEFAAWVERMKSFGAPFVLQDGPAAGMWTTTGDRVTRLAADPVVPADVIGPTWVVTEVSGVPYPVTVSVPTFTVVDDGTVLGYDGCNRYGPDGATTGPCRTVDTVRVVGGPFEPLPDGRLQVGDVVAARFSPDRVSGGSPGLIGNWQFNDFDGLLLNAGGDFVAGRPDCLSAGTWDSNGQSLRLTVTSSTPCPSAPEFGEWLQATAVRNVDIAVHDTARGIELWVMSSDGAVTRLVKM